MMFRTYTEGDPREFMYFNGEYYINGSEIVLSDEYIATHTFYGKPLWKYAKFDHKTFYNNQTAFFFCASRNDWLSFNGMGLDPNTRYDYAPYFVVTVSELSSAIKEFSKPIKLSQEETEARNKAIEELITNPKSDFDYPELIIGWILYIAALVGFLIFKEFYILWAAATFIFFKYRKGIVG